LAANYGVYGPAFELWEHMPREPGSEEYRDSEKYQQRFWDLDRPDSLRLLMARVNRIRRENPALQRDRGLRFLHVDNDQLLAYAKASPDGENVVVTVVNLDPHNPQWGWVGLEPASVGVKDGRAFQMHDLLSGQRFTWQGDWHYVRLDPHSVPAHIFVVRRRHGDERDFDYFL
jgi:starch synthase (maltosyl-transferring)